MLKVFDAEVRRLQLRMADLPGLAATDDGLPDLLARMHTLQPPVTWRDVMPDLPEDWTPGHGPLAPYRPFGSYDYQQLPTGPAVHVAWDAVEGEAPLEAVVTSARSAGFLIHGAGILDTFSGSRLHGMIILDRATTEDDMDAFWQWIVDQRGIELVAVPRKVGKEYR